MISVYDIRGAKRIFDAVILPSSQPSIYIYQMTVPSASDATVGGYGRKWLDMGGYIGYTGGERLIQSLPTLSSASQSLPPAQTFPLINFFDESSSNKIRCFSNEMLTGKMTKSTKKKKQK